MAMSNSCPASEPACPLLRKPEIPRPPVPGPQALTFAQQAKDSIAGALVGVFFMYIIGGYWRSELARHYATCRTMQDVSGRLAKGGLEGGGAAVAAGGRSGPGRGKPPSGRGAGNGDSDAYRPLASGPSPGRGIGRGRGRREAG